MNKTKVSFDRAAHTYDKYAIVQRKVAQNLFHYIQDFNTILPKVCEIGAGTGFFTDVFLQNYPETEYLVTDISPNMVKTSKEKLKKYANVSFMEGAAENINLNKKYNLIVSSFCLQWVQDLEHTLSRLWTKTENMLAFTTLIDGTFKKLKEAYLSINENSGVLNFMTLDRLEEVCSKLKNCKFKIIEEVEEEEFRDIFDFARRLQGIGAHSSGPEYRSVDLKLVDEVLGGPFSLNYQVAYCLLTRT